VLLEYKVHQDDYHGDIQVHGVRSMRFAVQQVQGEIENGYDVTNVQLDGEPLDLTPFCTRVLHTGAPCPNRADKRYHRDICITHQHQDAYNEASAAGRYQGD
jgi:hypothetical protein